MRFHWLRCRNTQGQFRYYWRPGTQNLADYFTKHHPATHHKSVCPTILTSANNPEYRKLFQNTGDSAKLEGTNNYEQKENFQKLPTLLNWRAQKITREAKLPKIAKKLPSWRGQKIPPITTSQKCRRGAEISCLSNYLLKQLNKIYYVLLFLFYCVFLPNLTLQIPSHSFVTVTFFSSTNK